MSAIQTNLPFKISQNTIIIVKDLPVLQCEGCTEYLLADDVMEHIDQLFERVDITAELEVLKYAA
jgi:YgiT-type zinc finger domain-containing protein